LRKEGSRRTAEKRNVYHQEDDSFRGRRTRKTAAEAVADHVRRTKLHAFPPPKKKRKWGAP